MGSNVVFCPSVGFFVSTTGMKITIVFVNIFIEEKLRVFIAKWHVSRLEENFQNAYKL